jgi:Ca2+-binding EF-hand superfamily protein
MSTEVSADTVWFAIIPSQGKANASARFLSIGQNLPIEERFQITHRQTNMYLTCDPKCAISTEFGTEFECFADRSTASGKLSLIVSEFKGLSTSQTLAKPDAPNFSWHFVVSSDKNSAVDNRSLPKPATTEVIIEELQSQILSKSIDGFWNLRGYFHLLENQMIGKGKFDTEDLKNALQKWGVNLKPRYLDSLTDLIDKEKNGIIDYKTFLDLLRGDISRKREEILFDVFLSLDKTKDGLVSIERIKKMFRTNDHPLTKFSGYSDKQVLSHLLKCLEVNGKPVKEVDFASFVDYYADLNVAIDVNDDEYFETIVRSNWISDE